MRLSLIDRILDIKVGRSITAVKSLSLAEEYLKDHFPLFPVMPGVLMLEAMYQASAWLIRKSEDFAHSVVLLKEARNIKYADFVQPGHTLVVTAEISKQDEQTTTLKAQGTVEGSLAVKGQLVLERFNLAERFPPRGPMDPYTRRELRRQFELLCQPHVDRQESVAAT